MKFQQLFESFHPSGDGEERSKLDSMIVLAKKLGSPERQMHFIHVAGTNGKGPVCAMLSAILTDAGYSTGLYTSSGIHCVNECIKINGVSISDEELAPLIQRIRPSVDDMGAKPSETELLKAIAFTYFYEKNCDIVILEAGLGGHMDATDIIHTPDVAVITNISLEHTKELGDTLSAIAYEEAEIIKEKSIVVTGELAYDAEKVFESVCREKNALIHKTRFEDAIILADSLDSQCFNWRNYRALKLGLLGRNQIYNALVVLETIEQLRQKGWWIGEASIRIGLASVRWPARLETFDGEPMFLLDMVRNSQCFKKLVDSLNTYFPNQKVVIITCALVNQDYAQMIKLVYPYAKDIICLSPGDPKALSAQKLALFLSNEGLSASSYDNVEKGILAALEKANGGPIVAFGSLSMADTIKTNFRSAYKKWQRKDRIRARDRVSLKVQKERSSEIVYRISQSPAFEKANCIMSYMAVYGEVDLTELHLLAKSLGKTIVYPCCISRTEMVALLPSSNNAWGSGLYGIREPIPERSQKVAPESIDLVICPCTAFDEKCNRLGMGAGYYDRYLKNCCKASVVAVAFELQKVQSVISEQWDHQMNMIFTEKAEYAVLDREN